MKKMMFMAILMVMTITANAMSYKEARNEALYLSDKMAYELDLTDAQYDAVYEINLDYMMSVNGRNDVYGAWWSRRNTRWGKGKVCTTDLNRHRNGKVIAKRTDRQEILASNTYRCGF